MTKKLKYYGPYIIVFIIALFGSIPLGNIKNLIYERKHLKTNVQREIKGQWGGHYTFGAIKLAVPYNYDYETIRKVEYEKDKYKEVKENHVGRNEVDFAAKVLKVDSTVKTERRYKGIYEVPIFRIHSKASIVFPKVDPKLLHEKIKGVIRKEAGISLGLAPGKEVSNVIAKVNEKEVKVITRNGHLYIPVDSYVESNELKVDIEIWFNGSDTISFIPSAEKSVFTIKSNWKDPKFIGDRLPSVREINSDGFSAKWEVLSFGNKTGHYEHRNAFGFELFTVLDIYHQNERMAKYGMMFIMLTIACLFLVQLVKKVKVHPIQFIFIIVGMIEFFFILLSLSEHISFSLSYLIASSATILSLGLYLKSILKDSKAALAVVIELVLLYAYMFSTIASRDYALLIGSVGMFVMIASAMFVTRKVDWRLAAQGENS